mgnify:FL=1
MAEMVPTNKRAVLGRWRRILFYTWIASSIAIAAVLMIGGPLVAPDGTSAPALIAYLPMLAMVVFIVSGAGWLIAVAFSNGRSSPSR